MSVLDDFFDKAKDVAGVAGKKTGELVEISKLKIQAMQINSDIKGIYEKLGSSVYSMIKANYNNPELVDSFAEELDEQMAKLKLVEDKIAELKNIVQCPCCNANNSPDAIYCSTCGCKLAAEQGKQPFVQDEVVVEEAGQQETAPVEETVVTEPSNEEAVESAPDETLY